MLYYNETNGHLEIRCEVCGEPINYRKGVIKIEKGTGRLHAVHKRTCDARPWLESWLELDVPFFFAPLALGTKTPMHDLTESDLMGDMVGSFRLVEDDNWGVSDHA